MEELLEQSSEEIAEEKPKASLHMRQCIHLLHGDGRDELSVRCYFTIDGRVFVAIPLLETSDSFLVGCAVRLVMTPEKQIQIETVSNEPVIRYMKSSVQYTTFLQPKSRYYYYTFLKNNGKILLPDYFTEDIQEGIEDFLTNYKLHNEINFVKDDVKEDQKIPGASTYAFKPLVISEKIH